mmetsp:Transcript_25539/g.35216  ORF Transcript_25539/g.35216 Transcript_25539/m.35216 type:complete len:215 (-) Transcript_25539:121-765(-)|eukprot:CAMPEP_0196584100 /NCGR_PEP_ID=MMETSP1081-20130531/45812_1 /TAXON_ID=36882 /ORGANISM="Pyramimonas amylifera, Strain CCMP720" /LENGTH=214 /DNA_ID=CAMNT_0041905197 /DNA_START=53 /DNA_END=697 /DNA_ORIENTATION=-
MVLIIDGELVPDSDPRAQARRRPHQDTQRSGGVGTGGGGSASYSSPPQSAPIRSTPGQRGVIATRAVFDFTQPILRMIPAEPGTALVGLPDAEVYGLRIQAKYIAIVLVATFFMGWRGLLVGMLVLMYLMSNSMSARNPSRVSTPPPRGPHTLSHSDPAGAPPPTHQNKTGLEGYFDRGPATRSAPRPLQPPNNFGGGAKGHRLGTKDSNSSNN